VSLDPDRPPQVQAEVLAEVIEFTDPGCSWAWGTEPKLRLLHWRYDDRVSWRRVLGGLVGDIRKQIDGEIDQARLVKRYIPYWEKVYRVTSMSYPVHLKWMGLSTEPACRAVKAAEMQSDELGARVLRRMREQIFIFGEPADSNELILHAVAGIPGLDMERFAVDLDTEIVDKAFKEDWEETRRPNQYVLTLEGDRPGIGNAKQSEGHWRFAFPTVLFRSADREETVPGWCDYEDYELALEDVAAGSTEERRTNPTPEQYFELWPTATERELEVVCGPGASPPKGVVSHDWGAGTFYLTEEEAAARKL
jgi:predicted DsbA family dithiol-disulfide isomerase